MSKLMQYHARRSANAPRLKAMVELAGTEPGIPINPDQLNQHPLLLNCPNGTLDLRTAELRPAEPNDYITQLCPTPYDPLAKCPQWTTFLNEIMAGNQAVIDYLARAVGYSLTGSVIEQVLFFCYGTGANGKSVFLGALQSVLGNEYSMQAMPDLLTSKYGERHPTELADLFGKRLVGINETEQDRQFAESLLKQLTGGDRIRARHMREDFWEYNPTHKLWIAGNHKPKIKGQDHGIWRRLHMIAFQVTIPKDKQKKNLPVLLAAEAPGILAWAVSGCQEWQNSGLNPPKEVQEATEKYRKEQDDLGNFIDDRCVLDAAGTETSDRLREAFCSFLRTPNDPSRNVFAVMMEAKGFRKDKCKKTGRMIWHGIRLRENGM